MSNIDFLMQLQPISLKLPKVYKSIEVWYLLLWSRIKVFLLLHFMIPYNYHYMPLSIVYHSMQPASWGWFIFLKVFILRNGLFVTVQYHHLDLTICVGVIELKDFFMCMPHPWKKLGIMCKSFWPYHVKVIDQDSVPWSLSKLKT